MNSGLQAVFLLERPMLLRLLRARLGNMEEAEDTLQDIWIKLEKMPAGPVSDPVAYLYRAASNHAIDQQRSALRRAMRDASWAEVQAESGEQPPADRALIARERLRQIEAALAAMPPRMRQAFRLYRFEGLARPQIATAMAISVSAVEKLLQRAYRHIREYDDGEGVWRPDRHRQTGEETARHDR